MRGGCALDILSIKSFMAAVRERSLSFRSLNHLHTEPFN